MSLVPLARLSAIQEFLRNKVAERVLHPIESNEPNLYIDWRPTDDRRTFFAVAINLSPYQSLKADMTARGPFKNVVNLRDGKLPIQTTPDSTKFTIEVPAGGGTVLMLQKDKR